MTTTDMKKRTEESMARQKDLLASFVSTNSLKLFEEVNNKLEAIKEVEGMAEYNQMVVAAVKANVIIELQKALSDDVVINIKKGLENTRLGFKTDKDAGYPVPVVRTCLIEAAVGGFYWHGNEFNIIAGNAYPTKEGLKGKMDREKTEDGNSAYTDVNIDPGIPVYEIQNRRATILVKATWKYKGVPDSIETTIPIKIQIKDGINYTTDDAVIGKAERKIRARIITKSTGKVVVTADVDEIAEEIKNNAETAEIISEEPEQPDLPFDQEKLDQLKNGKGKKGGK